MVYRHLAAFACLVALAVPGWAAAGAEALFEQLSHDFGSVPRSPLLTHYFRLTNSTQSPVHIAGVRVSCGCVAATALQAEIAPGQSSAVYATMDTRRFAGAKTVTIFVTFDRPQWEEVRLTISAYGRDDMALDPEQLNFGTVTRGAGGTARMTVALRQSHWAVQRASADSGYVNPTVKELRRTQSEVVYEVTANLRPGLPVGRWVTDVYLTTNSPVAPTIRVPATVEVAPALIVSPGEVTIGPVEVGSPGESKLIVRGGRPFKITEIQGTDGTLAATPAIDEARPVHVVTVTFDPKATGEVSRKLRIVTDLPGEGTAEVTVKARAKQK
jgi:hypothetical protein